MLPKFIITQPFPVLKPKTLNLLAVIYTIALILVSVMPINSSHTALNHNYIVTIRLDYFLHAGIFIPWIVLIWMSRGSTFRTSLPGIIGWVFLSLLFAALMEFVQYLLPYRAYNINDLLSNLTGVLLGYAIVVVMIFAGRRNQIP